MEAVNTACYLANRSPSTSIDCKTPQEVRSKKPYENTGLRMFGCSTYAHVNDGKLELMEMKCIFLGYASRGIGRRMWYTEDQTPKFIFIRHVTFIFAMCNQSGGSKVLQGTIKMLARMWSLKQKPYTVLR